MQICPGCNQPADLIHVDFGIGFTDFWGFASFHRDVHLVTRCCEAEPVELFEEPEEEIYEADMQRY